MGKAKKVGLSFIAYLVHAIIVGLGINLIPAALTSPSGRNAYSVIGIIGALALVAYFFFFLVMKGIWKKPKAKEEIAISVFAFLVYLLFVAKFLSPVSRLITTLFGNTSDSSLIAVIIISSTLFIGSYLLLFIFIIEIWQAPNKPKETEPPQTEVSETIDEEIAEVTETIEEITEEIVDEEVHEIQVYDTPEIQEIELDNEPTAPETKALEPTRKQLVIPLPNFRKFRLKKKPRISTVILSVALGMSLTAILFMGLHISKLQDEIFNNKRDIDHCVKQVNELHETINRYQPSYFFLKNNVYCTNIGSHYYHEYGCSKLKTDYVIVIDKWRAKRLIEDEGYRLCPHCH